MRDCERVGHSSTSIPFAAKPSKSVAQMRPKVSSATKPRTSYVPIAPSIAASTSSRGTVEARTLDRAADERCRVPIVGAIEAEHHTFAWLHQIARGGSPEFWLKPLTRRRSELIQEVAAKLMLGDPRILPQNVLEW